MKDLNDMLIDSAFFLEGKLVYKKLKNRYRIFCMKCQRYEYVSKEQFKQIRAARVCPMCFQDVEISRTLETPIHYYIMDDENDGYRVHIDFCFGRKPRVDILHVMRDMCDGRHVECRYIGAGMSYGSLYYRPDLKNWAKREGFTYLYRFKHWMFDIADNLEEYENKRAYIYLSFSRHGYRMEDTDGMVKSNQKKLMIDNLLSPRQMEYVVAFDLKSYDEVYKYRRYMRENGCDARRPLNVYYLDYLYRNNIRLRDFYDYMDQCQELGFKLDKPKDFQYRHAVLSDMLAKKRNAAIENAAKKRYKKLIKKAYEDGGVQILPFKDGDEIRKCGKTLHNCIASNYLSRYAEGDCDLFYLAQKGKIKVAIEVCDKKLIQALIDHNKDCPPRYMKHINKWMKQSYA